MEVQGTPPRVDWRILRRGGIVGRERGRGRGIWRVGMRRRCMGDGMIGVEGGIRSLMGMKRRV